MGVHRTCGGEPDEIMKNTHPKHITALLRGQADDAWARYDNVVADCLANCTVEVRFRSAAKPDKFSPPPGAGRTISIALGAPLAANIIATTEHPVSSADWTTLRLGTVKTPSNGWTGTLRGETLFIMLDGECFVDYFRFVEA